MHLRGRMKALGMAVTVDAAGNLRGVWEPSGGSGRRLMIGSHIDTVPDAGAFDGVLGVVLALELVTGAKASGLPLSIEVIAFSEEEGVRFGVPFLGSRAVAGRFDPSLLDLTDSSGTTLRQSIRDFGLEPNELLDVTKTQTGEPAIGFLEIHIEQGPVLEAEGKPLAVVTAIAGQTRCEVTFIGQANHAGTTPMSLRKDALAAAADWIVEVEKAAKHDRYQRDDSGLVATVGRIVAEPNAGNVIAGRATVSLDIRSTRDQLRNQLVEELLDRAGVIAERRSLSVRSRQLLQQPAVPMDERLTAILLECVGAAGFPQRSLSSGAGHDAMVMATRLPTAMLFLRSPGGVSHHPDEAVLESDVEAALQVGTLFLRRLASTSED